MRIDNCFLCGSRKYHIIHKSVRGDVNVDVLKCDECGLVRLSEVKTNDKWYSDAEMRKSDSEENMKEIRSAARKDDLRRYEFIRPMIENLTYLDFGCGSGGVLNYAINDAKRCIGIELERNMLEALAGEGLECYYSVDAALGKINRTVDVISMFHVLEHIEKPLEILEKLKMLLKDKGKMIIEVPNADDVLLSLYESEAFADFTYWEAHLYLYNNETLRELMRQARLKVCFQGQIQRYSLSNTLYWLAKGKPGGHKEWAMLSNEDIDRLYGEHLANLGIADTIVAVVEIE